MKPSSVSQLVGQHSKTSDQSDSIAIKGTNPLYAALNERRGSYRPQPKNTDLYEVTKSDTLAGIAARFNTTPSELANLNKLGCRTIFPGQIIYVPELEKQSFLKENKVKRADDSVNGRHSPKPGHVQRVSSSEDEGQQSGSDNESKRSPSLIAEDLNKESLSKFLKINAKHITDGEGVVSGVLLITPNHVMFDPNVSDALVIEHGAEKYGVVAPMHMVVRAALYPDIVRMKGKDAVTSVDEKSVKLYHSKTTHIKKSHSQDEPINPNLSTPMGVALHEEKEQMITGSYSKPLIKKLSKISECSFDLGEKLDGAVKSMTDIEMADVHTESNEQVQMSAIHKDVLDVELSEVEAGLRHSCSAVPQHAASQPNIMMCSDDIESSIEEKTRSLEEEEEQTLKKKGSFEKTKQKFQKGLRKLSITDGFLPTSLSSRRMSLPASLSFPDIKIRKNEAVNHSSGKKSKVKESKQKTETCVPSYMNMVEEKPELFTSVEKLIPRPAKSFNDNPLYLCLRMGQPKKMSVHMRVSPVMDFGCKLKHEYWFSIPRSRVDNLYWFFLRWAPEKYGDVDVDLGELGFLSVDEMEEEIAQPPPSFRPSQRRGTWSFPWRRRKSDEILEGVRVEEEPRSMSWELVQHEDHDIECNRSISEFSLPDLMHSSDILKEEHIKKLTENLPARAVGYSWALIYSTAVHGFSLKTLYREMAHYDTSVLLVIASTSGVVFGAMLSDPLKLSDHFYGTGETFLYTFFPEFKCFHWSGENLYFMKGNTGSFAIGASDGQFGLWLDDDLFHGCTKRCQTFANDSLCDEEDFVVRSLEAWGFI